MATRSVETSLKSRLVVSMVILSLSLAGCSTGPVERPTYVGSYNLTKIGDVEVPVELWQQPYFVVQEGGLLLSSTGEYYGVVKVRRETQGGIVEETRESTGRYRVNGDRVTLTDTDGSVAVFKYDAAHKSLSGPGLPHGRGGIKPLAVHVFAWIEPCCFAPGS